MKFNLFFYYYVLAIILFVFFIINRENYYFLLKNTNAILEIHIFKSKFLNNLHIYLKMHFLLLKLIPIFFINKLKLYLYVLSFVYYPIIFVLYEDSNFSLLILVNLILIFIRNGLFFSIFNLFIIKNKRSQILFNVFFFNYKKKYLSKKVLMFFLGNSVSQYFLILILFYSGFFFQEYLCFYEQSIIFKKASICTNDFILNIKVESTFEDRLVLRDLLYKYYIQKFKDESLLKGEGLIFIFRKFYINIKLFYLLIYNFFL